MRGRIKRRKGVRRNEDGPSDYLTNFDRHKKKTNVEKKKFKKRTITPTGRCRQGSVKMAERKSSCFNSR